MVYKVVRLQPVHRDDWNRLYSGYAAFYQVEQTAEMRDRVWNWIMEGRIIGLVVLDADDRPLGIAHLREFLRPLSATVAGYLDDLYVDPAERGAGLVNVLFVAARELGQERGWSVIRWITREDNYRARAVYDRLAQKTNWVTYDLAP
jgi:ribosomal protein S18 acetylase RimI-like enzyme